MGNHLAPASSRRHPQPSSPEPPANNGGDDSSSASSSSTSSAVDVDVDVPVSVPVPIPALPHDVLFGILLRARLPGKQLCRLRAVCRSWRAVLSDLLFVAAHAAGHPDLLVAAADADLLLLDDAASSGPGRHSVVTRVVMSRDGPSSSPRYYSPLRYMRAHLGRVLVVAADQRPRVLVDPDTAAAESFILPEPDRVDHHRGEPDTFFVLGWAPAREAPASNAGYKVLSVTRDRGRNVDRCRVMTLGGGGGVWREAPSAPVDVKSAPWAATVANDGVVYILAVFRRLGADWIAAFDLRTERWRRGLIRGPPSNALSSLTTTESGGCLVAVSGSFSYASAVHLWRLTDRDGDVWHKMCTVHVSRIIQRAGGGGYERADVEIAQPLWVLDGGERIAFLVWSPPVRLQGSPPFIPAGDKNWVLRVYDPRTKSFQDVARVSSYMDVAIGVYGANNLLRAQEVH